MAEVRIRDLEPSLTVEEIALAVATAGNCAMEEVHVGPNMRVIASGLGMVWIRCPLTVANVLVREGGIRVGWSRARVDLLPPRPLQCYKCLEGGHVRNNCPNTNVDRSNICYRCGEPNHRARDCSAPLRCPVCADRNLPTNHRVGSAQCTPAYKRSGNPGRIQPATRRLLSSKERGSSRLMEVDEISHTSISNILKKQIVIQPTTLEVSELAIPIQSSETLEEAVSSPQRSEIEPPTVVLVASTPRSDSTSTALEKHVESVVANDSNPKAKTTELEDKENIGLPQRKRKGPPVLSDVVIQQARKPPINEEAEVINLESEVPVLEYDTPGGMQCLWDPTKLEERPEKRRANEDSADDSPSSPVLKAKSVGSKKSREEDLNMDSD